MRMQHIEVRNFGCHRHAALDLSFMPIVSVGGRNGAGKSSLIVDAPLFALYGKCRVGPSSMVTHGETSMSVAVIFLIGGSHYRVTRTLNIAHKRPVSSCSIAIAADASCQVWTPVANYNSQATINALVPEYRLMTATSFALQGKLNVFSSVTPAERKLLFNTALSVSYAPLKLAAGSKARALSQNLDRLKDEKEGLSERAEKFDVLREAVAWHAEAQADAERGIEANRADLAAKTSSLQAVAQDNARKAAAEKERAMLRDHLALAEETIQREAEKQGEYARVLSRRSEIEGEEQRIRLEWSEESRLAVKVRASRCIMEDQRRAHEAGLAFHASHVAWEKEMSQAEDDFYEAYREESARLGAQAEKEKKGLVTPEQLPCTEECYSVCPLMAQTSELRQAHEETMRRMKSRVQTFGNWRDEGLRMEASRLQGGSHLSVGAPDYRAWTKGVKIEERGAQFTPKRLENARLEIKKFEAMQETFHSDTAAYECARGNMQVGGEAERASARNVAALAEASAPGTTSLVEFIANKKVLGLQEQLREAEERFLRCADLAAKSEALTSDIARLQVRQTELHQHRDGLLREGGKLAERLADSEQAATLLQFSLLVIEKEKKNIADYESLVSAYGAIPVMLIEAAIPLLEHEANELLSWIAPSGNMQVSLVTQRDLKTKEGVAETLDIMVSMTDSNGIVREGEIESFSGGERMRVDLALRVALARMLSRRAGITLELLVLDEAMWAIDEASIPVICACLETLSTELQIIVITQRSEEVEMLPFHIRIGENSEISVAGEK